MRLIRDLLGAKDEYARKQEYGEPVKQLASHRGKPMTGKGVFDLWKAEASQGRGNDFDRYLHEVDFNPNGFRRGSYKNAADEIKDLWLQGLDKDAEKHFANLAEDAGKHANVIAKGKTPIKALKKILTRGRG
jgi:hypothetical protein